MKSIPFAPDHSGLKVSLSGVVTRCAPKLKGKATGGVNYGYVLQEMLRHFEEAAARFYNGDTAAADELFQLYCIAEPHREEAKRASAKAPADLEAQLREMKAVAAEGRKAGREEALRIILMEDAEDPFDSARVSEPIGDTGDYGTHWDEEKLREILDLQPGATASLLDRLEAGLWDELGQKNDAVYRSEEEHLEDLRCVAQALGFQIIWRGEELKAELEKFAAAARADTERLMFLWSLMSDEHGYGLELFYNNHHDFARLRTMGVATDGEGNLADPFTSPTLGVEQSIVYRGEEETDTSDEEGRTIRALIDKARAQLGKEGASHG